MWQRVGNIYRLFGQCTYINQSTDANIVEIRFQVNALYKYLEFTIFFSPDYSSLGGLAESFFNNYDEYSYLRASRNRVINSRFFTFYYKSCPEIRKQFNLFFQQLNHQFPNEVPKEVIEDIDIILSNTTFLLFDRYKSGIIKPDHIHTIEDRTKLFYECRDRNKKKPEHLLFEDTKNGCKKRNVNLIADLLSQGLNPNVEHFLWGLPIQEAVEMGDLIVFKLLVFYKADPRKRPIGCSVLVYNYNAFEIIKMKKIVAFCDFLKDLYNLETLSPRKRIGTIKIDDSRTYSYHNEIRSYFRFSNGTTAHSFLITTEDYHKRQDLEGIKFAIKRIFPKLFVHREGDKVLNGSRKDSFSSRANKWIEVIFENDKPVGFNIFQVAFIQGKIVVKTEDAGMLVDSSLRGQSFNLLMTRRLAYAIKILMPTMTTAGNCLAISYYTYRMMRGERCTPYNRSPHMLKFNLAIIRHDNPDKSVTIVNDCYYEDRNMPSVIKERQGKVVFDEYGFDNFILWKSQLKEFDALEFQPTHADTKSKFEEQTLQRDSTYTRGAVMTTIIDKTSFEKFSSKLSPIGIKFKSHCLELASALLDNKDAFLPLFKGLTLTGKSKLEVTYDNIEDEPEAFWGPTIPSKL